MIRMNEAEEISSKQKQASIGEFFEKNKHFLGFDTQQRAIITAVKEAVDNSLDACEEARILPDIRVELRRTKSDELEMISQDNGPGIPRDSIEGVFGKFLLGSRFHALITLNQVTPYIFESSLVSASGMVRYISSLTNSLLGLLFTNPTFLYVHMCANAIKYAKVICVIFDPPLRVVG